ncbi:hypothetical protein [Flavihumibacter petaseus]|nr:hypothetical protein [Flavihumibacter petaseus]
MHVRISDKGRQLINNRNLAYKVVETVINQKAQLDEGKAVKVDDTNTTVQLVTTIKEAPAASKDKK